MMGGRFIRLAAVLTMAVASFQSLAAQETASAASAGTELDAAFSNKRTIDKDYLFLELRISL
jgi:hypothetical protein